MQVRITNFKKGEVDGISAIEIEGIGGCAGTVDTSPLLAVKEDDDAIEAVIDFEELVNGVIFYLHAYGQAAGDQIRTMIAESN